MKARNLLFNGRMYTVKSYKQSESHPNRAAAVEAARALSSGIRGEVQVESDNSKELLVYVMGEMIGYQYRTR